MRKLSAEQVDMNCAGCIYEHEKKVIRTEERTGYTWAYKCIGTKCANWPEGTPQNLSYGCAYWKPEPRQMTIFDFLKPEAVNVKGLCDDPYCPKCNFYLDDPVERFGKCPNCGTQIDFTHWFEVNKEGR